MENDKLELETIGIETDITPPYTLIENSLMDIEGLSSIKKMFIIMIRRYAGSNKRPAFPSYKKLQKTVGAKSPATIMKCIDFFVWLKWIERINRKKDNGENYNNLYILSLRNIEIILKHFNENNISFIEIEKYFELNYKVAASRKEFLSQPCKYLK